MMSESPQSYGLPLDHTSWRPHQLETVKWITQNKGTSIIQAPTGSGKTGVGAALGRIGTVRSLTNTINLQRQYEEPYGFDAIFGMANYPCAYSGNTFAADSCVFPENMWACPDCKACEYLIQRNIVRESQRQSLSYAYWLNAHWPKEYVTNFLYCDEAHLLPAITKSYVTIEYTPQQLKYMDMEMYPIDLHFNSSLMRVKHAIDWLNRLRLAKQKEYNRIRDIPRRSPKLAKKMKIIARELVQLGVTIDRADETPTEFYCNWDTERFKLMPLSARMYFRDLFLSHWSHRAVLTSATIGNPDTLARELGLPYHQFRDVPSAFPPESMPVFVSEDFSRLSHKSGKMIWRKWADDVFKLILKCDSAWSGIVHVSSKNQASSLANALARLGLQDRVYIPEGKTTGDKLGNWQRQKRKVSNTIAITYSFHMGLDAFDDEINIIGKVPYETLDEFGMAILRYDEGIYRYNAAVLTEQAAGRIRRGVKDHYEEPGEPMRKFVAIVDGNYKQIQDQFSTHFRQCLTEL